MARYSAAAVFLAGLGGLLGWITDLAVLARPSAGHAPMSFITSILLCLAALATALPTLPASPRRRLLLGFLGVAIAAAGGWTLLAYLAGASMPSDTWLMGRRMAAGFAGQINRMSPASTVCFTLFGSIALLRLLNPRRWVTAVQVMTALGLLLALVSLIGYLYSLATLVELRNYKPIAPQTAVAFFLIFAGAYLSSPSTGVMRTILSGEPGGILARRLLLFVFFIPLLLGAAASAGLRTGLFNASTSVFFLTATANLCLGGLLLFNAFSINRAEADRRAAQKSLEISERAYRTLFQNAADPMFLLGTDLVVLEANAAAAVCLQTHIPSLQGRRLADLTPACATEMEAHLRTAFRKGHVCFESTARTPDGRDVPLEINARAMEFRGAPAVLTIARDLSERRRADRELAETEKLLHQAQKMEAIGRLAGGVAHDFNNLLTVIMGYAELLLQRPGLGEEAQSDATEVKMCASRAAALTRQLLAFSRQQPACPRTTDADGVVSGMAPLLRRLIGENIRMDIRLDASQSKIFIDPNQLEQVVLNLAVNARDAMPEGGTLTIRSCERLIDSASASPLPANGRYVELSVQDTGCGIPPDVRPHIFEPFFTTKSMARGTGLGLSTVYGIVIQNGGAIVVDTSPHTGTAMRVLFPVSRSDGEMAAGLPAGAEGADARRSATVLMVEDEPAVREYLCAGLRRLGCKVLAAESGAAALHAVELFSGVIDAVVSDVVMPGICGGALAAALEEQIPGVRILFMSGYDQNGQEGPGTLFGKYDLITKPFTVTELAEKLFEKRQFDAMRKSTEEVTC
jgi:two-component system, cell cycle sensor histidine kinase and response regulator CckA